MDTPAAMSTAAKPLESGSTGRCAPDLWFSRKFVPMVVIGLSAWSFYVAVGRVCVPAIHRHESAGFSRPAGIGILVVFIILWLMFMWSFAAICLTPPGYARDVVPRCERPPVVPPVQFQQLPPPTFNPAEPNGYELQPPGHPGNHMTSAQNPFDDGSERTLATNPSIAPSAPSVKNPSRIPRPVPPVNTFPRWCQYCEIIKPPRTHHCRHCGTCIMQFDHHCVWIGRCVGWANHAIFLAFNFWAGLFCLFNMLILIIDMAIPSTVDAQKIVLIVICGFLALFTLFGLLPTHILLVLGGKTTLESFQTGTQERAEQAALKLHFPAVCPVSDVRRVRREWKEEYGGTKVNDRWLWGPKGDMWRQEMGDSWIGWILPIGRPRGDGINFASNPRFGPNGEWLRMEDWPKVVAVKNV